MTGYMKIPIYVNDSSLNMYQNEVMNLFSFQKNHILLSYLMKGYTKACISRQRIFVHF